jgi:hypothetical protein
MESIKRRLIRGLWFALALVFLFESWLWDHVKDWLRALGRLLGVERYEAALAAFIARLSPPLTLAVFAVPALAILPLKILALATIAHGHILAGLAVIFAAKTLALGVTAFLFDHCRDKLLQMAWFAHFYSVVLSVRAWAHDLVEPMRLRLRQFITPIRARAAEIFGAGQPHFSRKLALLRALARRGG